MPPNGFPAWEIGQGQADSVLTPTPHGTSFWMSTFQLERVNLNYSKYYDGVNRKILKHKRPTARPKKFFHYDSSVNPWITTTPPSLTTAPQHHLSSLPHQPPPPSEAARTTENQQDTSYPPSTSHPVPPTLTLQLHYNIRAILSKLSQHTPDHPTNSNPYTTA